MGPVLHRLTRLAGLMALWPAALQAFAHAEVGSILDNAVLPCLDGSSRPLLTNATANVFVFFNPGQEHSRATLKEIATCEAELSGKSVYWVAIVSDRFPTNQVLEVVKQSGIKMPVMVDAGNNLFGKLGVRLFPVAGIADRERRLVAYLPFTKLNYGVLLEAQIRHLLKEIDDAALERALHPPEAMQGGESAKARRQLKLAERMLASGKPDNALQAIARCLELDPSLAAAFVVRGRIHLARGNREEARKDFDRALVLEPGNRQALAGQNECQDKPD